MKKNALNNINNILDTEDLPKRPVKIEKRDKGLYERASNATIILTEDNKQILTD